MPQLQRRELADTVSGALTRFPVVALVGPRQCGKSTLARTLVKPDSEHYFDLERPDDLRRLSDPMTVLQRLRGTIVLDEVQRAPELFPVLRVLSDERPLRRRLLVLGSASPQLLRQSSESLAGRLRVIEMSGFTLDECGRKRTERRWLRGGFPNSFLAHDDRGAFEWLHAFLRSIAERDLPGEDARLDATAITRLLAMLAHYHGKTLNVSAIASSLGINGPTVRRYVDLLTGLFHLRQLQPWTENMAKRQVRSPKLIYRDSGVFHELLGVRSMAELERHPSLGASWEGFVIEEILAARSTGVLADLGPSRSAARD